MSEAIYTSIPELLSKMISGREVQRIAGLCEADYGNLEMLYELSESSDDRVSTNALWCMTHLPKSCDSWLQSKQGVLIDRVLIEKHPSKKRLLLTLLRNQNYAKDSIRTDFLDFCFSKINSECEPYAIRAFSIYCAFKMCRFYPELIAELEEYLDMLNHQANSPGILIALHQTKRNIRRLNGK